MPTFADLLSSKIAPPDPDDLLRDQLGQGQNLVGLSSQPGQGAAPPPQIDQAWRTRIPQGWMQFADGSIGPPNQVGSDWNAPFRAPSPNVAGPLAALAKPRIKLKTPPAKKNKPRIKLKASAYG